MRILGHRSRGVSVILAAILVGWATALPTPAAASFPGANGRIVITQVAEYTSITRIATMASDGTDVRILLAVSEPERVGHPEWSPGGAYIAFARWLDGNWDIWRMNVDGTGVTRLARHAGNDVPGGWSADAARIVFSSDRSGDAEIYSMRADGTDLIRLTTHPGADRSPAWSPTNDRIAYVSGGAEPSDPDQVVIMRPDGSHQEVVATRSEIQRVDWSSDGRRIAYDWTDFDMQHSIFEYDTVDGTTRQIDALPNSVDSPAYAPDADRPVPGAMLFSLVTLQDERDIYLVGSTEGAVPAPLTNTDDIYEFDPGWQPVPAFPLVDARFSSFAADIEWLYGSGITKGCNPERFCPNDPVSRGQMAAFLDRALALPTTSQDYFTDDSGSTFEAEINRLAAAGITKGCGGTRFCPNDPVSRGQMAAFLRRALDAPTH